jgi:uncharacterized protein (TIGR00369 family)
VNRAQEFQERGIGKLPGHLGIEVARIEPGRAVLRLPVREELLAPNGYLHAASVVALADTAAGYGCVASLPEGAVGFTTIELKSNFLGTTLDGAITTEATLVHGGRTTQIWDAPVQIEDPDGEAGKVIALFRCTQLVLHPR